MYQFSCDDCGEDLYLDYAVTSKSGKRIPLEVESQEPHRCPNRDYSIPCRNCKEPITFDPHVFSKTSGKKIPLDADTGEPHDCLAKINSWR